MRKSNTNVIFLFLILLISIMTFASASFSLGKGNVTLIKTYGPGSYLTGYMNISFQNQSLDSQFKDNQGNNVSFIQLLNLSKNKNYVYKCDVIGCGENYKSNEKLSSKTYNLSKGEDIFFGIEFKGIIEEISSINFNIDSDAGENCENQLKLDILNDDSYEFSNSKTSSSMCSVASSGCYNASTSDVELAITSNPLCQKINLSEAPGYYLGAWIIEKSLGNASISLNLYTKYGVEVADCNLNKSKINSSGGEVSCGVDYLISNAEEHYVCLYSSEGTGEYKTKGHSLTKGCGFSGLPIKNGTAAYDIFAKPKKFGAVGSLDLTNGSVSGEDLAFLAEYYIYTNYGSNDCTNGCYVPMKINANVAQNITLRNFSIKYSQQDLPGIEDTKFHVLEKISAKISSGYQYLFIDNLFKLPTRIGNFSYTMNLNGVSLMSEKLQIKNVSMTLNPTKVSIASVTTFRINLLSNSTPIKYYWLFEGENKTKETVSNQISYIYLEGGNHELMVGIETKEGEMFSKNFIISVQSARETANSTLKELETNLATIKNQILTLDSFNSMKISDDLNLTFVESQIKSLRSSFNKATNESEYLILVNALNSMDLPDGIIQTSTNSISYYSERENINLAYLANISGEAYNPSSSSGYVDGVLAWNQLNIDTKVSMREIDYKYDSDLVPFIKTFSLQFSPKNDLNESVYLIIEDLAGLEFNSPVSEGDGFHYVRINDKTSISFSTTEDIGFVELPLFLSPVMSSLPVLDRDITEQEPTPWWILAILFAVVIILGIIVYFILHKWYDKKYEHSLFPNRNHLYNLITYINNQKTSGVPEEEIREKLIKAKWSSEQIRYVMRKYLGKNTGMWKPGKSETVKEESGQLVQFNKGIRRRSIFWHIFLGIITLGLYLVIWLFLSSHELRKITKKAPRFILLFIPYILITGDILFQYYRSLNFTEFEAMIPLTTLLIINYLVLFLAIIIMIIALIKYSKALKETTGFSTVGAFLLLLLVYPIETIVAQVQLNRKANIGQKVNKQSKL